MKDISNLGVHIGSIIAPKKEIKPKSPINLLPEWLQTTIKEHSESFRTPKELWAVAFLSGISTACGKKYKLINGNYSNYAQLWIMIVGQSGTGKSEAFRVAFERIEELDEISYAKYQMDYQDWKEAESTGTPPQWIQNLIKDVTPEALFKALSYAENGLTLYRDELSGWFSDFGRYARSGEIGHYLSIFDNSNFSINRKGDRPQLIPEPFLNIFGTIQPKVLQDVLSKNNAETSGFAQRFLYLYPEFPIRQYRKGAQRIQPTTYNHLINSLYEVKEQYETELTDEAEDVYAQFYDDMEAERSKADDFWSAVYSKAQIQVLRLALTIKVSRLLTAQSDYVEAEDVECAVGFMRIFIDSLKKFKNEQIEPTSKKALIMNVFRNNPDASQTEVAKMIGVSQQYISKVVGCKL